MDKKPLTTPAKIEIAKPKADKPASAAAGGFTDLWKRNGTWIGFFGLVLILVILTKGDFLSARNVTNLMRQTAINGILAAGMTMIIITAGIDLSIGSVVALAGIFVGITQVNGGYAQTGMEGALLSLAVGIGSGLICGLFSGSLISTLGIAPFVITLGMMVVSRGLALIFSNGSAISPMGDSLVGFATDYLNPSLSLALMLLLLAGVIFANRKQLSRAVFPALLLAGLAYSFFDYRGMPTIVLYLGGVLAFTWHLLQNTVFGRSLYAIGSNSKAAYFAGVNIKKTLLIAYTLMGAYAGFAGVLLTSRLNGADPNAGQLFELDAIAAVVIGGTSLRGGSGSVVGSIVGALTIATLNNGMDLMGVPSFYQMVLKGFIIILAVAVDRSNR
jgi:ribose/xylose/arabinose/galactoside ABC-type transport system permease subunit